jgi:hypothetical protein
LDRQKFSRRVALTVLRRLSVPSVPRMIGC